MRKIGNPFTLFILFIENMRVNFLSKKLYCITDKHSKKVAMLYFAYDNLVNIPPSPFKSFFC